MNPADRPSKPPGAPARTASLGAAGALLLLQFAFVAALFGARKTLGATIAGGVSIYTVVLLFMTLAPWLLTWAYTRALRAERPKTQRTLP